MQIIAGECIMPIALAATAPAKSEINLVDQTIVVTLVFATWFLLFVIAAAFAPASDGITLVFVG
jgi:hypothetical protein